MITGSSAQRQAAEPPARRLHVAAAAGFLRAQSASLLLGLEHADDPHVVGKVLGGHDVAHGSWLALIADVEEALGPAAAEAVAGLYGLHGRVVGSLERGHPPLLPDAVTLELRRVLAQRLEERTTVALAALHAASPRR